MFLIDFITLIKFSNNSGITKISFRFRLFSKAIPVYHHSTERDPLALDEPLAEKRERFIETGLLKQRIICKDWKLR